MMIRVNTAKNTLRLTGLAVLVAMLLPCAAQAVSVGQPRSLPLDTYMAKRRVVESEDRMADTRVKVVKRETSKQGFMKLDRALLRPTHRIRKESTVARTGSSRGESKSASLSYRSRKGKAEMSPLDAEDSGVLAVFGDRDISSSHPFAHNLDEVASIARGGSGHGWPVSSAVKQRISSDFGIRKDPFTGKPAFHQGIDIAAKEGTPVKATERGRVSGVGMHPRLGRFVKIEHEGGVSTQYGHLLESEVATGDFVRKGQIIGRVGNTGRSTGPHLDYSVRIDGKPVDPLTKVKPPARAKSLELSSAAD